MATVALVVNTGRRHAVELAHQVAGWLVARHHRVRVPAGDAQAAGLAAHACPEAEVAPGADLAVSLGGDGTMLRAVRLVAGNEVPVLGVNVGRLGFLAPVEPDAVPVALERFVAGDYSVDERLLLHVEVVAPGAAATSHLALNEAVVEKTSAGQVVHVKVSVDQLPFISYAADGLIVGTPTGSTAYAFSARGPIVAPALRAFYLTPVSPHMTFDRSVVFEPDQSIRLQVTDRAALLIVDGEELGRLEPGAAIDCTAAKEVARFVTFGPTDFFGVLKAKFRLSDR